MGFVTKSLYLALGVLSTEKLFKNSNFIRPTWVSLLLEITHFQKKCSVTCNDTCMVSLPTFTRQRDHGKCTSNFFGAWPILGTKSQAVTGQCWALHRLMPIPLYKSWPTVWLTDNSTKVAGTQSYRDKTHLHIWHLPQNIQVCSSQK